MAITKTDFMRGMQCPKMLWLDKHKPGLKVIPPEIQEKLAAGNDFGDRAMGMFGPYEEMTVYRPGTTIITTTTARLIFSARRTRGMTSMKSKTRRKCILSLSRTPGFSITSWPDAK